MKNKSFIIKYTHTEHKVVTLQSTNVLEAEHNSDANDVSYVTLPASIYWLLRRSQKSIMLVYSLSRC